MKWLCIMLLASMAATCGQHKRAAKRKRHAADTAATTATVAKPQFVAVDASWVAHYQELEKEFHYTVHDDSKIKAVGNRFSVPVAVREHYQDMLRAKGAGDTPADTGGRARAGDTPATTGGATGGDDAKR